VPFNVGFVALTGSVYCWGYTRNVWTDVKIDNGIVYLVSWKYGSSIQTVDSNVFATMNANGFSSAIAANTSTLTGYSGSHNIQVYQGYLYLFWNSPGDGFYACGSSDQGTIVVDTSNMTLESCISDSIVDVGHDMACHQYKTSTDPFFDVCFIARGGTNGGNSNVAMSGYGTVAVNVNNPASISQIYTLPTYSNMRFTHEPALTNTGSHLIMTDECDEYDVGLSGQIMMRLFLYTVNSASASLVQTYDTGNNVSDHQGYFHDKFYFLAAYKRGFLGFELNSGTNSLSFSGWLDTWAYSNGRGFAGAWSVFVFPYTACGGNTYYKVVISDNSGMYIMQPRWHAGSRSCDTWSRAEAKVSREVY